MCLRSFSQGNRPVIRWIKGDGLDDVVTRAAIAQATRLFGKRVDYCLCTTGVSASRVREVLAWAVQPVEWWRLEPGDSPELAAVLIGAGCDPAISVIGGSGSLKGCARALRNGTLMVTWSSSARPHGFHPGVPTETLHR